MAWFKVDDGFYSSRKVVRIPRARRFAAVGLWILAGTWCARNLTDGRIEKHELEELGGRIADARALVECGLWQSVGDAFVFHNWSKYQPTKEQVEKQRDAEAERKRRYRENIGKQGGRPANVPEVSQWDTGGTPVGQNPESGHPDPTRPDPARPDPLTTSNEVVTPLPPSGGKRTTRGSRLEPEWKPTAATAQSIRESCPDVDLRSEHPVFVDYWISTPGAKGVKLDWEATWRNWMRRKQGDVRTRAQSKPTRTEENMATVAHYAALENDLRGIEK